MNGTPVVFGVGVLKGPFLPNVHSVSSLLLSVPVSASVASSVCPFPAVWWKPIFWRATLCVFCSGKTPDGSSDVFPFRMRLC